MNTYIRAKHNSVYSNALGILNPSHKDSWARPQNAGEYAEYPKGIPAKWGDATGASRSLGDLFGSGD
jgi:hypothetical protein